jgi:hypothetical protein
MSILLGAALLLADPIAAAQPAVSTPVAAAGAPKKVKKICKSLDGDTGTHMSRRVCKTPDEWTVQEEQGAGMDGLATKGARTR